MPKDGKSDPNVSKPNPGFRRGNRSNKDQMSPGFQLWNHTSIIPGLEIKDYFINAETPADIPEHGISEAIEMEYQKQALRAIRNRNTGARRNFLGDSAGCGAGRVDRQETALKA